MSEPSPVLRDVDLAYPASSRDAFIVDLNRSLGAFGDPRNEMDEALDNAAKRGFIFEIVATGGGRAGMVVITETPFQKFQPRYHLAYIAVLPDFRGKGYGKILLAEARKRTEGDIALHVSPENRNAIEFYERQGWKIKYTRMMPVK